MKKILCLAISLAMVLSLMLIPASAANAEVTLTVTGDTGKAGDIITATYTVKGVESVYAWQGIVEYNHAVMVPAQATGESIKYKSTAPEATTANAKKAIVSSVLEAAFGADEYEGDYEESPIWGQTGVAAVYDEATMVGKFTIYASAAGSESDMLPAIVSADGYDMFTLRFVRLADDASIDIKFAEGGEAPVIEATDSTGNVVTSAKVNYDSPNPPTPVTWDGFTADETANWATGFKYLDENKAEATEYTGTKVVCFGKNASGAELAAESYGITIGKRVYTGKGKVAAGGAFAIVIVDTTGEKITKDAYNYDIWTGSEANVVKAGLAAQMN